MLSSSFFVVVLICVSLIHKLARAEDEDTNNDSYQQKLHEIQSHMMDEVVHHHKHDEADDGTRTFLDDDIHFGDPSGPENSIKFGKPCIKKNPQACENFPEVTCVWVEESTFVCRCDFQHTYNSTTNLCTANVFAPCAESFDCGENMECRPDSIGSNPNVKMCRCVEGYIIDIDDEGLPSRCIFDKPEEESEKPNHGTRVLRESFKAMIPVLLIQFSMRGILCNVLR